MIAKEMWAALGLYVAILSGGHLLFKQAALNSSLVASAGDLRHLIFNAWLWVAVILYGAATLLWVTVLQRVPVSTAIFFNALSFVLVPVGAAILFGETLGWRHAVGGALIISGLVVVVR